jgi:hypothetical protein
VTLVYQSAAFQADPTATATHVLLIGCGAYPHMAKAGYVGVKPLGSPPLSVSRVADWFLGGLAGRPASQAFSNADAPVGSVEMLISPQQTYTVPGEQPQQIDEPTFESLQTAYENWLARLGDNPASRGVLYYCGHGISDGESQYLVADDFGVAPNRKWRYVFNVVKTIEAAQRSTRAVLLYFIDACMEFDQSVVNAISAPMALIDGQADAPLKTKDYAVIRSTTMNRLAYAPQNGLSRFTDAFVTALSGFCGKQRAGTQLFEVTPSALKEAMDVFLDRSTQPGMEQTISHTGSGANVPIHVLDEVPKVLAQVAVNPVLYRVASTVFFEGMANDRRTQGFATAAQAYAEFQIPRGEWVCGVEPTHPGSFQTCRLPSEYMVPPHWRYDFTIAGGGQ